MPSTPRASGRGRWRLARLPQSRRPHLGIAALLFVAVIGVFAAQAGAAPPQNLPPHFPPQPTQTPNWPPPNWPPPGKKPSPTPPPLPEPEQTPTQAAGGSASSGSSGGMGGVAGIKASGGSGRRSQPTESSGTVTAKPVRQAPAHHSVKRTKPAKAVPAAAPPPLSIPVAAPQSDSERSTFADRLLTPGQIDLSAENLGKGGVLAFLLAALLYLPITIFNKATEKNHDVIERWLARPRAWLAAIASLIPFHGHTLLTLVAGVLASTALFSFVEPGFPHESGSFEYAIGMLIGFAVVSAVFFGTWRYVIHWLEPHSTGRWRIYPPYIVLAACFVLLSRFAHLLPGVVIGTVAEYEPSRKLNRRTAGIRVANTYGALLLLGLIAWFAWIPVEHAASHEGASSLTLILDSALAIIFVSSLESVAFGLIPMRFLDGNDLYVWRKPLWAAMWGASLLWFSVVILHPALSTYSHLSGTRAIALAILFGGLMFASVATWGYFRWRDARLARAAEV